MPNVSVTQQANYATIAAAVAILIAKVHDPSTITQDDVVVILGAIGALISGISSFINRFKKGDVTLAGKYKE